MDTKSYASLLRGLKEAVAIEKGEMKPSRVIAADLAAPDVAVLRRRLGLSQAHFAAGIGVPVGTLRNWEQGIRIPKGPARVLLHIVEQDPRVVFKTVAAVRERSPAYQAARKGRHTTSG
jgi:putative transcriptional regulator